MPKLSPKSEEIIKFWVIIFLLPNNLTVPAVPMGLRWGLLRWSAWQQSCSRATLESQFGGRGILPEQPLLQDLDYNSYLFSSESPQSALPPLRCLFWIGIHPIPARTEAALYHLSMEYLFLNTMKFLEYFSFKGKYRMSWEPIEEDPNGGQRVDN